MQDAERFKQFVVVNELTGCHVWRGAKNRAGYGQFGFGGDSKHMLAHRFAFESVNGPIPDGLVLDHLCLLPRCVNPAHLEAVTLEENNRRALAYSSVFVRNIKKTKCNQGHPLDGPNVKTDSRGYRVCIECEKRRAKISLENLKARGWRKVSEAA